MSYTRGGLGTVARCIPRRRPFGLAPGSRSDSLLACRGAPARAPASPPAFSASSSIFAAFVTQLEPLANHTFLWAHLLQNVVLAEWAPALLVLGVPPRSPRAPPGSRSSGRSSRCRSGSPTYYTWHLPWIYDAALRHPHSLLHLEHLTYLAAGLALWWPVVHGRARAGAKAAYLFAAFMLASPLGLLLALIPRAIYPFYAHAPRRGGRARSPTSRSPA